MLEQKPKALLSMLVTLKGMAIEVRLLQPEKACNAIFLTEFGIFASFSPSQP